MDQMFRSGSKTMSEAVRAGGAAWALDDEDVLRERALGTRYLGILIRDVGEIWLTSIDAYTDRKRYKTLNYTGRGGSLQRYLPFHFFVRLPGTLKKL